MRTVEPAVPDIPGFKWLDDTPPLQPQDLVYVGLRDVDPAERRLLKQLGVRAYTIKDVDKYGIGKVMEMALDHVASRERPLHLSYDVDAVDPEWAPSTGTVVGGGLNYREAHYVAEAMCDTGLLQSMDLVEINPSITSAENGAESVKKTVEFGRSLVASALGKTIL
jgi:arginase